MINKINVEDITSPNSIKSRHQQKKGKKENPNFRGVGAVALAGIQACEKMPMINVAVIDLLSAILPRTIVESLTNWFAGFEAFRRESSGLIVNCLIPCGITYILAKGANPVIMPKGADMSGCWADRSLVDKAVDYYKNAKSEDKVFESLKNMIGDIQGFDGKDKVLFKETSILSKEEIETYARKLAEISRKDKNGKEVSNIAKEIVQKTHISEHITIDKQVKASSVENLLSDTVKFFREFQRVPKDVSIEQFGKNSKKLILTKSFMGLAVILPLAISMQYINRWITGKVSGVKGAPIYEDFGKEKNNIEEKPESKKGLFKQKIISISSMIGVALLSMMKKPTLNMLEFKGIFPTMDQARIISTSTFASRMAAADDKNELVESTIRDIATFCGLYFFGDYAAKGMATYLQNKTGITLLNDTKPIEKNASTLKKFVHWVKDVNIKSSEEVFSKTQKLLKGAKPTKEQLIIIEKEIEQAKNLRAGCQLTNLGVSLALLGIIIPIFTRRNTKKKHEQALRLAAEKNSPVNESTKQNKEYKLNTTETNLNKKIA